MRHNNHYNNAALRPNNYVAARLFADCGRAMEFAERLLAEDAGGRLKVLIHDGMPDAAQRRDEFAGRLRNHAGRAAAVVDSLPAATRRPRPGRGEAVCLVRFVRGRFYDETGAPRMPGPAA